MASSCNGAYSCREPSGKSFHESSLQNLKNPLMICAILHFLLTSSQETLPWAMEAVILQMPVRMWEVSQAVPILSRYSPAAAQQRIEFLLCSNNIYQGVFRLAADHAMGSKLVGM